MIVTKPVHIPVLVQEVVEALQPAPGKVFIDATVGFGGHSLALLQSGAKVIGLDRDSEILKIAEARIKDAGFADQFVGVHNSFSRIAEAVAQAIPSNGGIDGILFDLGVSSYQLDTPERGFSFRFDAPLDMRMDKSLAVTAADLVNGLGKKELYELFTKLGEEYRCRPLIEVIIKTRKIAPIKTTSELVVLVEKTIPRTKDIHPATKIFQALRMAVNSEREELKAALPSALSLLAPEGVLVVISFHSLEDSIVKDFLQDNSELLTTTTSKPITPTSQEVASNPRSRSAKLRLGVKK
jgi:16S rRNA (cytosine1402-N4)-methyltransferase